MNKKNAFISYSQNDREKVSLFANILLQNNYDVWMNINDINYGESILSSTVPEITKADIYMLFISCHSVQSPWLSEELDFALSQNEKDSRHQIIPVLLDDQVIPIMLSGRMYIDASKSIQHALDKFNNEFGDLTFPQSPTLSGITFELSKETYRSFGAFDPDFTKDDLIHERQTVQKELRKKANAILFNYVSLSDFDLQSPVPKFKNGMYDESVESVPGDYVSSIREKIIAKSTIFNPDEKKIRELLYCKFDELHVPSITYTFSIPFQKDDFDRRCLGKIQDNYEIISYDYIDGAMIEYEEGFYLSIKCTNEQISITIHSKNNSSFSKKAAEFSTETFINWLVQEFNLKT